MAATTRRLFELSGYSLYDGIGFPLHICSAVFAVGGYDWCIEIVPNERNGAEETVGFYLRLATRNARATASFEFSLVDPTALLPPWVVSRMPPVEFDSTSFNAGHTLGASLLKAHLDAFRPGYVGHTYDRLLIECTVTVVSAAAPPASSSRSATAIPALDKATPPSDMMEQLGKLFATKDGADVVFAVEGELFPAHRVILAMRSPVFKAGLYGPMKESGAEQLIKIGDMRPDVFRALLAYIYTDSLPTTEDHRRDGDVDGDDGSSMMWDLLVAADRYGVERLRVTCERVLCARLAVDNVANLLGLADQYHFETLKDACIEFMTTSCRMDKIKKTEGYVELRSNRLSLLVEVFEKASKFRKL